MFRGYYPHFVDIYVLCGYYWHFVEISMFRRYYRHIVEISTSRGYYRYFVDIICIDHIMSYLARNVRPIFHIYSFSESDWYMIKKLNYAEGPSTTSAEAASGMVQPPPHLPI